jgi:hypothetical protein
MDEQEQMLPRILFLVLTPALTLTPVLNGTLVQELSLLRLKTTFMT